jgi:hypothetical protein
VLGSSLILFIFKLLLLELLLDKLLELLLDNSEINDSLGARGL